MSVSFDAIRKMLLARQADDGGAFRRAVEELIADERRRNHHVVARELERLLNGGGEERRLRPFRTLHAWENDIPKDGDRGLPLLMVLDPQRELAELVLSDSVRGDLERFAFESSRAELLRAHGVAPPSRLLLCGPPGCGKTSVAEAVARRLLLPLVVVRFDVVISSYLGETASNLRKIFDFVATRPMVVLFDEFDAIAKHRDDDFEHGELKRVVNAFLQLMDGLRGDNVIVAATNHQGMLDSAVWRRFDEVLQLGLPDSAARRRVLLNSMCGLSILGVPDWETLLARTESLSHADVERIAHMAVREALLDDHASVAPEMLMRAAERYQMRMHVVGSARSQAAMTRPTEATHNAVPEGQPAISAPRDAYLGTVESSPETTGPEGGQTATARARAKRPVRPRHRAPGGATPDGDEKSGTGSGD